MVTPCQFPFYVNGKKYSGCIKEKTEFQEYHWCSTGPNVLQGREHTYGLGLWGICNDPNCVFIDPNVKKPISCKS